MVFERRFARFCAKFIQRHIREQAPNMKRGLIVLCVIVWCFVLCDFSAQSSRWELDIAKAGNGTILEHKPFGIQLEFDRPDGSYFPCNFWHSTIHDYDSEKIHTPEPEREGVKCDVPCS
ncbi:hypothetical protein A3B32_02930 [Candidatus Uhrbacteria bacterium RIFCSPLOWO2_01_FULL_53_9]|uniref:Uncharacterized protein n=2 Tax=Candidatus Uhriibacteriota TaxID=1752732 RepID=A0A1F7V022_9BACT|nr:MAG: hypothetical protein A3B32_02930 [Candidatus Uhrbacteria bacterium RIFCSPLOWO2_01_FULL_53_9]